MKERKLTAHRLLTLGWVGGTPVTISEKFAINPLQKVPHKNQDEPPPDRSGTVCWKKFLAATELRRVYINPDDGTSLHGLFVIVSACGATYSAT